LTEYSAEQIAKWRDGKSRPPFWPMVILCREAGLTVDWLADGSSTDPNSDQAAEAALRELTASDAHFVQVPVLDVRASAGNGAENGDAPEIGRFPMPRRFLKRLGIDHGAVHMVRAHGDSMWPTINDGALCAVNSNDQQLSDGRIYALNVEEQTRLKRVQVSFDGGITLISDNRELYPSERLSREDREGLRVAGRVFWTERVL
jgi:phage repressor protein C with HTH and peptisase S24 domain